MIFLWTSNGGPMQYIGLLAFFIQLLPYITAQLDPKQVQRSLTIFMMLGMTLTVMYGFYHGTWNRIIRPYLTRYIQRITNLTGIQNRFLISIVTCLGVFVLTTVAMSTMDIGSFLSLLQMGVVFMVLKAQAGGHHGRQQQQQRMSPEEEEQSKQRRFEQISNMIQTMPIEEFVPPSSLTNPETCSLSQLRTMLEHRGVPKAQQQTLYVERQQLIDAIESKRNYCETCCICCEDYQQGDSLRILPKCKHEFHLECVDQWAYTFANKNKRSRTPSCPLCNTSLE